MGYDITYHPIAEMEMHEWYFDLDFERIQKGDHSSLLEMMRRYNIDDFYANKYVDTVKISSQSEPAKAFDLTHGYGIAVIQGFFRKHHYTRGTAFSFLIDSKPHFRKYTKRWQDILSKKYSDGVANAIVQNYSSGVYIPANAVVDLLNDYETDGEVKKDLEDFYDTNLPIFLRALNEAKEGNMGVLEATEVIEPNPMDVNKSSSYSNLYNCDPAGVLIYAEVAKEQVRQAIAGHGGNPDEVDPASIAYNKITIEPEPEQPQSTRRGFFKRFIGK